MNTTNPGEGSGEKRLPETSGQSVPHNLTTIQNVQGLQTVQNIVQSTVPTIQSTQNVVNTSAAIVGKSISLDLNQKLSLMKSVVQTGTPSTSEPGKIALCPVGSTVRIIPSMVTVDRQGQPQMQIPSSQPPQTTQQVVTSIPATYHVPRGPAAVANISAPRSTVATPIVRASTGQSVVPISRVGVTAAVTNTQWPTKAPMVHTQPQRLPVPPVSRVTTRPPTAVYSGQQPRLVAPAQSRPIQTTVVANVSTGAPSRLLTPVLQSNSAITRIPVAQPRATGTQIVNTTTAVQAAIRHPSQPIQLSQQQQQLSTRPSTTGATNRVTVATPVGTASRITNTTPVAIQPTIGRPPNPTSGVTATSFNRVVIPSQQVQQPGQSHPPGTRVVQTITSLANISTVSRIIAATTNPSNIARVTPSTPTSVPRIASMTLHPLPITTTRGIPAPVKPLVPGQAIAQAVQIKTTGQPTTLRVAPANVVTTSAITTITTAAPIPTGTTPASTATIIINSNNNSSHNSPTPASQSSLYTQYRQASVQPVRLIVEPSSHEENHGKPNASPRPSILRKRDHENSPAKGAAKNLVPMLTSLPLSIAPNSSPPMSPRNDRDGGCQSSGSTTVSATSSPGLDEEPEQSRIPMNQTMEMSPRKKPRKQQLTGVELTEPRCSEEDMQFITEDKFKRDTRDDIKDRFGMDKKQSLNSQQDRSATTPTVIRKARPTPSLIDPSWKNRHNCRLNHYRRPSDVRPREERRPTVAEIAQQKYVLQRLHGWKIYQLTAQMEDLAELEKQVHDKLKTTLCMLESQQPKPRQDDDLERVNELIKGNMQRSSLISEGMTEARTQLVAIFEHKSPVNDILQRFGNKRAQKKREK
ncbi:mucin-2 [Microplitis mediator]|uniref:mucin-2 n=1 Tax=Microplitis mediator TaxID=375433 RepID=UPI00255515BC|nr:mucin-2 [Microplitis mediator]